MERGPLVEDIQNYAQNIVDTVREPLLILDATLRVRSANRAFYQTFHVSPGETEGRLIYELGNGQWDIPDLRTLLEDIVPKSSVFDDFELEHTFPAIGRRVMLLNAAQAPGGPPRRAARPGHGGRHRTQAIRGGPEGHRDLRAEHRGHGAGAAADPRRDAAGAVGQPGLLPDVPRLARGDGGAADLRAGQRPVGHPRPADPAGGHRPQELGLRRLRAGAHLPGDRPAGDAAERAQAPGGPPRRAARPGHGGRHRAAGASRKRWRRRRMPPRPPTAPRAPSWRTCRTRSAPP